MPRARRLGRLFIRYTLNWLADMDAPGYFKSGWTTLHVRAWPRKSSRRSPDSTPSPRTAFGRSGSTAEIKDPDGKSFFLMPPGTSGDDARAATLMTYILNAGTGYGKEARGPPTSPRRPTLPPKLRRIMQAAEGKQLELHPDVGFVDRNGGRLVTTPNGILMGLGGNWIQRQFSQQGGTTWGDIFMVNMDDFTDPAERLRQIIESGHAWYADGNGTARGEQPRTGPGAAPRGACTAGSGRRKATRA